MHLFRMVVRAGLLACSLGVVPAAGQTTAPPAQPTQTVPVHRFLDRFNAANTTHDGRLTLAQAQAAGMPRLAQHFSEIDTQKHGYITLQDIRAWRQQMRASRAGSQAAPGNGG
jgi:hypothetical protein